MKYIKLFEQHSDYETYITTIDKFLPNLSYCEDAEDVHLSLWRGIIAKFNVTDISTTTKLTGATSSINRMEVDGITLNAPISTYQFQDTGIHVVKYELKNPAQLPNSMFYNCTNVIDITIPETVTSIKTSATFGSFYGCTNLQHVLFKGGIKYFRSGTDLANSNYSPQSNFCLFYNCKSLTSIGPIGSGASVEIPESVLTISGVMFYGCTNLTTITIPKNVASIFADVFYQCSGITEIYVEEGNTTYRTDENHKILLSNDGVVLGLDNTLIPQDTSITNIYRWAYSYKTFDNPIVIPNNITRIDTGAFANTNTSSIDCSNTNATIDSAVFRYCKASSIKLPNSITSISESCFESCSNLTSLGPIGSGASLELPSTVKTLKSYAFQSNYFTSIRIPNVTTINQTCFNYAKNITSIGPVNSNADFEWPSTITTIPVQAFYSFKKLTTVEIPNGVTKLNQGIFNGCSKLNTIIIPSTVTSIDAYNFDPQQLTNTSINPFNITINKTTPPTITALTIQKSSAYLNKMYFYVPAESVNAYKSAQYWSTAASRIFAIE